MRKLWGWLWLVLLAGLPAGEKNLPVGLWIRLQNLQQASAPFVYASHLLFSYRGDDGTTTVKVAMEDEDSRYRSFPMKKNGYGIYVYWMPLDTRRQINYRYIVNGLWMRDQLNTNYLVNDQGLQVSFFTVEPQSLLGSNPVLEREGQSFYLRSGPGKDVYLVGSFNSWNPFSARMAEVEPGLYYLHLQLPPGEYFYLYHQDGKLELDPRNTFRARNSFGMKFSKLLVE